MLLLLRVDDRLLHGQVGTAWTPKLQANFIVIANDKASSNAMLKMTIGLAKPAGVDLKILPLKQAEEFLCSADGAASKNRFFVITESIADAAYLTKHVNNLDKVNLGGIRQNTEHNKVQISRQVFLNAEEMKTLAEMEGRGVQIVEQVGPLDSQKNWHSIQESFVKGGGEKCW